MLGTALAAERACLLTFASHLPIDDLGQVRCIWLIRILHDHS